MSLDRFVRPQQQHYFNALDEIRQGKKISHWMWYMFPQIRGLGSSDMSKFYALEDLKEATLYLKVPTFCERLIELCNELLLLKTNDAHSIFGSPDDMKLKSSMTLFSAVPDADPVFKKVLDKFFKGELDNKTIELLNNTHK